MLAGTLAIALAGLLVVGASGASAAYFPSFTFGESGEEGGQLRNARGVAINETGNGGVPAGTVYVAEFGDAGAVPGNNRISSFDADGDFIRAWGWDVIAEDQPNDTGAEFEICEEAAECKAGSTGSGDGQFAVAGLAGGIAVNQASGDVYAVDRGNSRVQQFTASGAFVRAWGAAGAGAGQFGFGSTLALSGLGIDAAGGVYVADAGNARVQKFDAEGNFLAMGGWDVDSTSGTSTYEVCTEPADCQAGTSGAGAFRYGSNTLPSFIAVSPGGDVYAVGKTNGTIYRLGSNLAPIAELASTIGGGSNPNRNPIAVNGAGNILFGQATVAPDTGKSNNEIFEVNPVADEEVARHKVEANMWVGLAVNPGIDPERLYGTRTTSATSVHVFENLEVPISAILPATDVGGTKATLRGTVNPIGIEVDECRFEYTTATSFEDAETVECAETPEEIGDGTDPEPVHADVEGLTPNTLYRFRLTASNAPNGPGPPSGTETFTTAETVITEPATDVSATEATLNGSVDPDGVGLTECSFEYGTTTAYGQSAPCDPDLATIGTGPGSVAVEADLPDLNPGTTYHFRLVATYQSGSVGRGVNRSFLTLGPVIGDTWSEDVTLNEAMLRAELNPKGKATTYRFEHGTQGPCSANPCASVPVPDGAVGSDNSVHVVSQFLEGLQAGATHHYRVVATNADAINEGPDRILHTYAPLPLKTDCANQAFRVGPSANLPDCRAYEMVSPVDKNGGDILGAATVEINREAAFRQASLDGGRVTFSSPAAFADPLRSSRSNQYLATREEGDGWQTEALYPPQGPKVFDFLDADFQYDLNTNFQAFTPDLCLGLMRDHNLESTGQGLPRLPEAIEGVTNLYLRDNCGAGATYRALTTGATPEHVGGTGGVDIGLQARAFSRDGSQAVFVARANLDSQPAAADNDQFQVYARALAGGPLRLVSVLPGGAADPAASWLGESSSGSTAPARNTNLDRAVSADGSRIFWSSSDGDRVYVRVGGTATVPVSSGSARFLTAAVDGSAAVYQEGGSLFEFDLDSETSTEIAKQAGGVVGASEDLSHLYFTSQAKLTDEAIAGQWNLYLRRDGEVRLIAAVAPQDRLFGVGIDTSASRIGRAGWVSPDGRHLAFMSLRPLTGFDSTDAANGEALRQVFRYDAEADELLCASCRPSGARPRGANLAQRAPYSRFPNPDGTPRWAAAWLPTPEWTSVNIRPLSDDGGRLFFNSFDALVPEDVNGAQDVYQWEAPGVGECSAAHPRYSDVNGGCVSLISTGRSDAESVFFDASANGNDVFFTTSSNIHPLDTGFIDVYDARVGGGFAPPEPPRPPCVGDACQPIPTPLETPSPASALFRGPGDLAAPRPSCNRRQVRRGNRCVAKRALARRACAKRRGKARQRCIRGQMRRLNRIQQSQLRAQRSANADGRASR